MVDQQASRAKVPLHRPGRAERTGWNWLPALVLAGLFCVTIVARNVLEAYGPPWWRPQLHCDPSLLDLGTVAGGSEVPFSFVVRNAGGRPLTIRRVVAECGCTTTSDDLAGQQLPPGESVVLRGLLHTRGLSGEVTKAIWLQSDDPQRPVVRLTLAARISSES